MAQWYSLPVFLSSTPMRNFRKAGRMLALKLTWKQFAATGFDLLLVCFAFYFGRWFGFALAVVFLASVCGYQILAILQTTRDVLLSRLPDRCGMCHREIVDEGGTIDIDFEGETKIYHEACSDKLDAMKEKEKDAAEA